MFWEHFIAWSGRKPLSLLKWIWILLPLITLTTLFFNGQILLLCLWHLHSWCWLIPPRTNSSYLLSLSHNFCLVQGNLYSCVSFFNNYCRPLVHLFFSLTYDHHFPTLPNIPTLLLPQTVAIFLGATALCITSFFNMFLKYSANCIWTINPFITSYHCIPLWTTLKSCWVTPAVFHSLFYFHQSKIHYWKLT